MNQEKQEMVLRKNQQDRQTFSQTNNQVVHNKNHKLKKKRYNNRHWGSSKIIVLLYKPIPHKIGICK